MKLRLIFLTALFFISIHVTGQQITQDTPTTFNLPGMMTDPMNYLILFVIVILLSTILVMARVIKVLVWQIAGVPKVENAPALANTTRERIPFWNRMSKKLNDTVPVEKEADILLDHDYDGIKELDNNLPPWWKYGFYFTIVFAFIYMMYYHVAQSGNVQLDEYNIQLSEAEIQKTERLKLVANNVDETNVTFLATETEIISGQKIYSEKCLVCHGKVGEGLVGPNLTDDYWLHGGSISDIFKIIKYGFPSKGMLAWQDQLTPIQIQQVASFVKSIKGTNPPNAKAPQGDIFQDVGNNVSNDTTAVSDTSRTIAMKTPDI